MAPGPNPTTRVMGPHSSGILGSLLSRAADRGIIADGCGLAGFDLPVLDPATAARLEASRSIEPAGAQRNPVDVTLAGVRPDLVRSMTGALLQPTSYPNGAQCSDQSPAGLGWWEARLATNPPHPG